MLLHIEAYIIGFLLNMLFKKPAGYKKYLQKFVLNEKNNDKEKLNKDITSDEKPASKGNGATRSLAVILIAMVFVGIIVLAHLMHPIVGVIFEALLTYLMLGVKEISDDSKDVYKSMISSDRVALKESLLTLANDNKPLLSKRNVAECTSIYMARRYVKDAISPMFYMMIGGPALGFISYCFANKYNKINAIPDMLGSWFLITISYIYGKAFNGKVAAKLYNGTVTNKAIEEQRSVLAWLGSLCIKYDLGMNEIENIELKNGEVIDIYKSNQLLYGSTILGEIIFDEILMIVAVVLMFCI